MKLCGENGHTSKAGRPCGFKIGDNALSCHHHALDKTREREIVSSAKLARKQLRLPESIDVGDLQMIGDLQRGFASVVRIAATDRHADLKRLDVLIRALNGANGVLQTAAVKELNETVLKAEGHGAALVILEGLKAGKTRRLPGLVSALPAPDNGVAS